MKVVIILVVIAVIAASLDDSIGDDEQLHAARESDGRSEPKVKKNQQERNRKKDERIDDTEYNQNIFRNRLENAFSWYKRALNWNNLCYKVKSWDKIIRNKAKKKDIFIAGAEALMSATKNGTSCGGKAANTTVNAVMETLKNCSTSIEAACISFDPNAEHDLISHVKTNVSVCNEDCWQTLDSIRLDFKVRTCIYEFYFDPQTYY